MRFLVCFKADLTISNSEGFIKVAPCRYQTETLENWFWQLKEECKFMMFELYDIQVDIKTNDGSADNSKEPPVRKSAIWTLLQLHPLTAF